MKNSYPDSSNVQGRIAMSTDLGRREVKRQTGAEPLHNAGADLGVNLQAFWQWSVSDVLSNATRGRLAEFIVARALGIPTDVVRDEWAAFDFLTPAGLKVEVKSAAFVQSWHQARLSSISFLTAPTRAWDASTNMLSPEAKRQADVYVFALLAYTDKATIDPLDVSQWEFYVLPTLPLNDRSRSQHSITLGTLKKVCGVGISFSDLTGAVKEAGRKEEIANLEEASHLFQTAGLPFPTIHSDPPGGAKHEGVPRR